MKRAITVILATCLLIGCGIFPKKPTGVPTDYLKKEEKSEEIRRNIEKAGDSLSDKGKAFVFGAQFTLGQETNKTPHVVVAERFLDLATLTLGNPSIEDAKIVEGISKGLIDEFSLKLEQERMESLKFKIANSNSQKEIEFLKMELKSIEKSAESHKKTSEMAEKSLSLMEKNVSSLQSTVKQLEEKHASELRKLQDLNEKNAAKASAWDEDNGFWQQFNIFKDIFSLIKKLAVISLIGGVLFLIFKVLEIFFPAVNILGTIFGGIFKMIAKCVPTARRAAGLVSEAAYSGFKNLVKATENVLTSIEKEDIESSLIINYPADYKFSKDEVKQLLVQHSEQIEKIIKNELKNCTDEEDRTLIHQAKIDLGIKQELKKIEL